MQKGDVIRRGFVSTDQDAPEAVQPTVAALHHPATGQYLKVMGIRFALDHGQQPSPTTQAQATS